MSSAASLRGQPRLSAWLAIGALGAALGLLIPLAPLSPLLIPLLPLVALVGLLFVYHPPLLSVLIFACILFDQVGVTGLKMDDFPVTLSKLAVLGSLAAWGVRVALSRVRPLRWHPVLSAMLAMVIITAVGIALTGTLKVGKFNLAGLAMMTVLVGLIYTILSGAPLQPLYRLKGTIFVGALGMAVLNARLGGAGGRASGTMGDPNEWATMVLMLTPFLLGGLASDDHRLARLLRPAMLLLAPLAILLSMSRTALAVALLILPVALVLLRHRRRELLITLGLALIGTPLVVDLEAALFRVRQLFQNLQGGATVRDVSLEERSELLRQGVQVFWDHWLIGAGPGNGPLASGYLSLSGRLRPVHNTYLEIASEQGLLGLLFAALFLFAVGHTLLRSHRVAVAAADLPAQQRLLGAAAGLGGLALMALTLGLLTFSMGYLMLGFALAIAHQASLPSSSASASASALSSASTQAAASAQATAPSSAEVAGHV